MTTIHRATRDEILASRSVGEHVTYVMSSPKVQYLVLGTDGSNGLYAVSQTTGLDVHVTPTGHIRRNGCPSVRVTFPTDTGDSAGTLEFYREDSVGGYTSASLTPHLIGG